MIEIYNLKDRPCTELEGYYEKHGWTYLTNGYLFNGQETKVYAAAACNQELKK